MEIRNKVTLDSISQAALEIVTRSGVDVLSMRTLAASLGIKAPSLYDHVKNRDQVIGLVQAAGLKDFGASFAAAGEAVRDKVLFYRRWALSNPNLYPVVFQQTLHRDLLPPGLEESVLGQVIKASGGSHVQARVVWAQLHGLVDLELQSRLPADADMDATWNEVINSLESHQKAQNAKR